MLAVATLLLASPLPIVAGWCSPDHRVRDRASVLAVARYGPAGESWRWASALTCPECQVRAERSRAASVSAALRRLGPIPSADSAWYDSRAKFAPWIVDELKAALEVTGRDAYPHELYRQATRLWVADALRGGVKESALKRLLDEMRQWDAAYYRGINQTIPWEK